MAWVERRVTRTFQPQELVGIDWSNPITRGLDYALINGVDAVANTPGSFQPAGLSPVGKLARGSVDYRDRADAQECTLISHHYYTSNNADWGGCAWGYYVSGPNNKNLAISLQGNADNIVVTYTSNLDSAVALETSVSFPYSAIWAITVAIDGGDAAKVYKNGKLFSNAPQVGGGSFSKDSRRRFTNATATSTGKGYGFGYKFSRILSEAEVKSLSDNPWQIFEPITEYVWVDDVIPLAPPNSKGRWIENKVQRTSQPQELVGIDWNNPLTVGLREFVTGNGFSANGNSVVVTEDGLSAINTSPYQPANFPANEVTIFQSAVFDAISNISSFGVSSGGDSGFGFKNNTTSVRLFKYRASGTANTQSVSTRSLVVGRRVNVCGTFDGASQRLYEGGALLSSTANAEAVFWGASPVVRLGGFAAGNFSGTASILAYFARALSDAEVKSLSDNPWQIFEPTTEYIWVNDFTTSGTTPVDSDRLINYLINTSSTTDLPLNYSIRTSAIQDAIFEYSINSSLSSDRSSSYNIRTSASSDDLNQYLIRTFANSDITSNFNTRTSAVNDEVVNYLIRANAAADADYSFNTRTNAFSDAGYSYLIRNATQVDFSTLYNIFGPLASDLIQSYNIRSSVNTSSTYNFNTQNSIQSDEVNQYNIRTTASNTTANDYNIRTNAGTSLESLYEIINAGQVSQALNIQYNIRALSDNSFNSYYLIYSAVGQNVDAAYNIRTNTFKDIQFSYDITAGISTVASDLTAMYNVLSTSSITQQDLINISTQVWNHSLTGDRTPGSAGSMLQDVSAREAAR